MSRIKRQLSDPEKQQVLAQQRRDGVLYCFVDDHPIADENEVEFHHIQPFSDDGPTEIENIGAVCKDHHRRIRTLSLSEFRDQLSMDRFFDDPSPRRLNDLLGSKLGGPDAFGRKVTVEPQSNGITKLHFTNPDRPAQQCHVFECPATKMRYFYAVLPIEYIANDADLQPRPLEQKRVWELYRHLTRHTQLAPAVCRLVGDRVLLFDGQHKSAAQIWAGRRALDCKVYIEPDTRLLKDTNLVAHDKLRQMAFFTSTLIAKYSDIFKQEWQEYLEQPGAKSESGFVAFLKLRGKTAPEAKKMLMMAIEQDVLEDPGNRLAEFIAERNRTRKNPLTIYVLQRTFFKGFVYTPPADVEIEGEEDHRSDEKQNMVRMMSLFADKLLIGKWNPDADNAGHKRAERMFSAGALRAWMPMIADVVAQVLQLYDAQERQRIFFRKVTDQQWGLIEGRVQRFAAHKIWDDPSTEVDAQLKVNAAEQVRDYLTGKGLTVNWILGGEGS